MLNKIKRWTCIYKKQSKLRNLDNNKYGNKNKILLIKLDAIGDFIIWLDSAKEYRKIFKGKKVCLLCNKLCAELAVMTGYFDDVSTLDISRCETDDNYFEKNLEHYKQQNGYEILVQTAYSRTLHMDLLAAAIPAEKKIAFLCDESKSNLSRRLIRKSNRTKLDAIYDVLIKTPDITLMELKRNGIMISNLSGEKYLSNLPYIKENKEKQTKVPSENYFVVFPGASTKRKMWDIGHFTNVTDYIIRKTGWKAYVCGSNSEKMLGEYLLKNTKYPDSVVNYCGCTDLIELAEVIRHAKYIISNDTSGIHYAAAVDTPGICVFGEYNYGRFLPYDSDLNKSKIEVCSLGMKCRNCVSGRITCKCIFSILKTGNYYCVNAVSEKMVIDKIDCQLKDI
jgi:ADP-heptose:LPS heptosyltransferase